VAGRTPNAERRQPQSSRSTLTHLVMNKNLGGRSSRPPFYFALSAPYFFFFELDFFFEAFLVAIVLFSLSILQSSLQRSFVAIVECIESLKNDVKQKMVDVSCYLSSTLDAFPSTDQFTR
jgi:hypothetical protein